MVCIVAFVVPFPLSHAIGSVAIPANLGFRWWGEDARGSACENGNGKARERRNSMAISSEAQQRHSHSQQPSPRGRAPPPKTKRPGQQATEPGLTERRKKLYLLNKLSTDWGKLFACPSMAVDACVKIWKRTISVESLAKSASRITESAACVFVCC